MDTLAPIAEKVKRCLRLLASNSDGEVIAAARALNRTLQSAGSDIHALADRVTQSNGLSKEDMKKLYDAGVAAGRKAAQKELNGRMFQSVDANEEPSWFEIASLCRSNPRVMHSDNEKNFVNDMCRRLVRGGEPTEKQANWLRKIYARVR
jgi:hypothetical protein